MYKNYINKWTGCLIYDKYLEGNDKMGYKVTVFFVLVEVVSRMIKVDGVTNAEIGHAEVV